MLGDVTTQSPVQKHSNVLTLNTAGSNLLLFSCPSVEALKSWVTAFRLSSWEKSRLEEIYTAHLIRLTLGAPESSSTLINGRMEGWVRIRIAGQTDWKRVWMTVNAGSENVPIEHPTSNGGATGSTNSTLKKKRMSLFSRDGNSGRESITPAKPQVSMFLSPRLKDRKKPLLTLRNVTQAFAVYPERPELISRSTLIKLEGSFGDEEAGGFLKTREGWLLVMPDAEGVDQAAEMLKWVIALHDAFELYGRPEAWVWDPRNSSSLMFAYPVGPNKERLFLERELAEALDPRDDQTSSIRSQLNGITLERLRGLATQSPPKIIASDKPPSLPPIERVSIDDPRQAGKDGISSGTLQVPPVNYSRGAATDSSRPFTSQATPLNSQRMPSPPISRPSTAPVSEVLNNKQSVPLHPTTAQQTQPLRADSPFVQSTAKPIPMVPPKPGTDGHKSPTPAQSPATLSPKTNADYSGSVMKVGPSTAQSVNISEPAIVQIPPTPRTESPIPFTVSVVPADLLPNSLSRSNSVLTSPFSETDHISLKSPFSDAGHGEEHEVSDHLASPYSPGSVPAGLPSPWTKNPTPTSPDPTRSISPPPHVNENSINNEAGALYFMAQGDMEYGKENGVSGVVPTIAGKQADLENSSLHSGSPVPVMPNASDRSTPTRQTGRKPSGARVPATRSYTGDTIASAQLAPQEQNEGRSSSQNSCENLKVMAATPSEDTTLYALAAISYLNKEDEPPLAKVEPLHINKAPSPPPTSQPSTETTQYRSSFAPSKQAAERKAKAQAQQAAHFAASHKPGKANSKGKAKAAVTGTWNESSDEEEEDEEDEDEDEQVDSDDGQEARKNRNGIGASSTFLRRSDPTETTHAPSQTRPSRTLPQVPGGSNLLSEEVSPSPRRVPSDQHMDVSRRTYYDGTQIRTQAEVPQPGVARQNPWSQVLEPGRAPNVAAEQQRDTFVQLEPAETMTKAFTPQGLLSAGIQDKQDRSAKRQEELARETGASLINVPNKPPPPQMGLLGAITAHERERKREGGVGAALTEREREKRIAEDRQRRFDDQQKLQLDQMQQGGSMYGGQFPGFNMMGGNPMMMMNPMNPMMGMNPMMTGGMMPMMTGGLAPMMTGQMGYPGMYSPQQMFAAQQAANAYQQAMMAFSGSQMGGAEGGPGGMQQHPMAGGNMASMGFDPRMSMMGMAMQSMPPIGMQMTGVSAFDARFPPNVNHNSSNSNDIPRPGGKDSPSSGAGGPTAAQHSSNSRSASPKA